MGRPPVQAPRMPGCPMWRPPVKLLECLCPLGCPAPPASRFGRTRRTPAPRWWRAQGPRPPRSLASSHPGQSVATPRDLQAVLLVLLVPHGTAEVQAQGMQCWLHGSSSSSSYFRDRHALSVVPSLMLCLPMFLPIEVGRGLQLSAAAAAVALLLSAARAEAPWHCCRFILNYFARGRLGYWTPSLIGGRPPLQVLGHAHYIPGAGVLGGARTAMGNRDEALRWRSEGP
jgi:hypothetical protein